jgi:hypothetical protein
MPALPCDLEAKLEIGKLYFKSCDFDLALHNLEVGLNKSIENKDYSQISKYFPMLLRILSEKSEFKRISEYLVKISALMDLIPKESLSKIYYSKGIASIYQAQIQKSRDFFLLAQKNRITDLDEIAALFGLATVALRTDSENEFCILMQRIHNLNTIVADCDFIIAGQLLESHYFIQRKTWDRAFSNLESALQNAIANQNIYMVLNVHYTFGRLYQARDEYETARKHYLICESFLIKKDLRHFHDQISNRLAELKKAEMKIQLIQVYQTPRPSLRLASGEIINFKNQFTLHKLFTVLAQANGQALNKEDIVKQLWSENYHPFQHDNKLHVTISRLRKILSKYGLNDFILNSENGYKLPPHIKVQQFSQQEEVPIGYS